MVSVTGKARRDFYRTISVLQSDALLQLSIRDQRRLARAMKKALVLMDSHFEKLAKEEQQSKKEETDELEESDDVKKALEAKEQLKIEKKKILKEHNEKLIKLRSANRE